jgi:hypothetical protein
MATLTKTPGAQWALSAVFAFDISTADAMLNTATPSALIAFSAAAGTTYDVIPMPYLAQVIGGDVAVLTVSNDTGTSTLAVGDSGVANRYLAATTIKVAGRTPLVPTGYQGAGEAIRLTIANQNGNATTVSVLVTVLFQIKGRINENLRTT